MFTFLIKVQILDFGFLVSGTWIPYSSRCHDSGFLELNSRALSIQQKFRFEISETSRAQWTGT